MFAARSSNFPTRGGPVHRFAKNNNAGVASWRSQQDPITLGSQRNDAGDEVNVGITNPTFVIDDEIVKSTSFSKIEQAKAKNPIDTVVEVGELISDESNDGYQSYEEVELTVNISEEDMSWLEHIVIVVINEEELSNNWDKFIMIDEVTTIRKCLRYARLHVLVSSISDIPKLMAGNSLGIKYRIFVTVEKDVDVAPVIIA
ncbi:endoglucanase 16-like protein [Corchorus olitorius]|uniref:Endoglucanase 16-like protein n=1 Tax=Corchorus olitorius TaxID=93759 RepID=A0A1R3KFX1_9ROSI|nr:endoglucanase 16-like protein [Corchorus olitorius]